MPFLFFGTFSTLIAIALLLYYYLIEVKKSHYNDACYSDE